jgi:apolipoprotein N-acyltransferase
MTRAPVCPRLGRLAERLGALAGWRRFWLALGLGLLSATAFAPLWFLPALLPAFMGLAWMAAGATRGRSAFWLGWAFGFGHFLGGFYWVGIAMTVDLAAFWWFLPISVGGLAAGMALYTALALWLAHKTRLRDGPWLLVFAALWLLAEWFRSFVLTGFPWNQLGQVWAFAPETLQLASVTGIWGLTLLTLLAALAPALLGLPGVGRRVAWGLAGGSWGLLLAALAFGLLRLAGAPAPGAAAVPGVAIRLVQPSVEQTLKWRPELRQQHLQTLVTLTRGPGLERVTHVVWPETAVPYNLAQEPELRRALGAILPPGATLITGAPRIDDSGAYNSLYALDGAGSILATFDKAHLVPFGEYVPFPALLGAFAVTGGGFTPGPGLATLSLPGLPGVSPLICYEVIFSGAVVAPDAPRPGLLLNLTNDAWFGRSSGPYQHLAQARLRAVEEGLPLLRAANNGVTAMLDPYGRVLGRLGLDRVDFLDVVLPQALAPAPIYATVGPLVLVPLLLGPVLLALLLDRRTRARH